MLQKIRKYRKRIFGLILVAVAVAFMLPFGTSFFFQGSPNRDELAKITFPGLIESYSPVKITYSEYETQLERIRAMYRQQLGAKNYLQFASMLQLEQKTLDNLIDRVALDRFTSMLGLWASSSELEKKVLEIPYFGGKLTREAYNSFLSAQGTTAVQFEKELREEIVSSQLQALLRDINVPTEFEQKQFYKEDERKAAFRFVKFIPTLYQPIAEKEPEEVVKQYFTDNSEKYRKPRAVSFKYVEFKAEDFAKNVELTEEDLKDSYDLKRNMFQVPKQIRLRRILFKKIVEDKTAFGEMIKEREAIEKEAKGEEIKENTIVDSAKASAESVLKRLNEGESFVDLAASISQDTKTSKNGGDLGWQSLALVDKKVKDAVASVDIGSNTGVVETKDGYEIYFVEDRKDASFRPFEEVRQQVENELRKENSPEYSQAAAEVFYAAFKKKTDSEKISLSDFAVQNGKAVKETAQLVSISDSLPSVPKGLVEKVITLGQGESEIVSEPVITYVVQILENKDAYIPEFEQIKNKVKEDFVKDRASKLAKEAAEKALQDFVRNRTEEKVKTLDEIAKEVNLKIETVEETTREKASGSIFLTEANKNLAFSLTMKSPCAKSVLESSNDYYLLELTSTSYPDDLGFDTKKKDLLKSEYTAGGTRLYNTFIKILRKEADIWISPDWQKSVEASKETKADV